MKLITPESRKHVELAKDARNLIHPGKATRSGTTCSKAMALTALAALYKITEELKTSTRK